MSIRRASIALLPLLLFASVACSSGGDEASTDTSATADPTSSAAEPTTTASPGDTDDTDDTPSSGEVSSEDAEEVVLDYLDGYFADDPEDMIEVSSNWAQRYGEFILVQKQVFGPLEGPYEITADFGDASTEDGTWIELEGSAEVTYEGATGMFDEITDRVATFDAFLLYQDPEEGLTVADFRVATEDEYGPLYGSLRDQIDFTGETASEGDVTVSVGPVFRSAGLGAQDLTITLAVTNDGTETLSISEGLYTTANYGGDVASLPENAITPTEIPPGEQTIVVIGFNKPGDFEDGEDTTEGELTVRFRGEEDPTDVVVDLPAFDANL